MGVETPIPSTTINPPLPKGRINDLNEKMQ